MHKNYLSLFLAVPLALCVGLYPAIAGADLLTRADAAKILLLNRTDHVPLFENKDQFPDVPRGHPNERYLLAAERYGILSADNYTRLLRPEEFVNRAQFLKMVSLTYGIPTGLPYSYTDVKKDDWFAAYAGLAEQFGIFSKGTRLEPTLPVTRDDAVLALAAVKQALHAGDTANEQALSKEQSKNGVDIYVIISSKRLNTVFGDAQPKKAPMLAQSPNAKLNDLRDDILLLVNAERAKAGAKPLTLNAMLNASAQLYAETMAKEGFFSHVSPDGKTLKDRIRLSGYYDRSYQEACKCVRGYSLGENLARGQRTPKEAVEAWMKSPSHKEAMLSEEYSDTGLGISAGLWVQHFGGIVEPAEMARQ